MPEIHPTAIIHAAARLAHDVDVGPYCIIEAGVQAEAGVRIEAHAQVLARTVIGENCSIGRGAILGADPQAVTFDPALPSNVVLGSGNRLREHVTIHRSFYENGSTRVGNNNFLMVGSHVGHDVRLGDNNILANNVLLAGHVEVGNGCFLGGGSVFHQFIRVGDLAIIQGNSAFSMDLPPYVIGTGLNGAIGLNVVGMKRAGLDAPTRLDVKRAFDLVYRSGKNFAQAVEAAQAQNFGPIAQKLIDFVASRGKRGVCPFSNGRDD